MSKQVKISDDLYKELKADADANFRSIAGHITMLHANQLRIPTETTPLPKKPQPETPEDIAECQGHQMRWDCGLKNCRQGN